MLKLTMNLPAEKQYFPEEQGIVGVIIKPQRGNTLQLRPTSRATKGSDFVPLTARGRGGVELLVDGELEQEISAVLRAIGQNDFFFLTSHGDSDWLSIKPYEGTEKYPPRTKPHLRAWNLFEPTREVRQHDVIVAELRKAVGLVQEYSGDENEKPSEVSAAETLINEIRSIVGASLDNTLVTQARDLLNLVLNPTSGDGTPAIPVSDAEDEANPDFSQEMGAERVAHERETTRRRARSPSSSERMRTAA